MKKNALKLSLLTALICGLSLPVLAENTHDYGYHKGFKNKKEEFQKHHKQHKMDMKKKLNLTEEQEAQAKALRDEGRAKMEPLIKQMKAERDKMHQLRQSEASEEAITAQKEKIKAIKDKLKAAHENNMKKFEQILTAEQKAEFQKIKAEMKQKREEWKKAHKGKKLSKGEFKGFEKE